MLSNISSSPQPHVYACAYLRPFYEKIRDWVYRDNPICQERHDNTRWDTGRKVVNVVGSMISVPVATIGHLAVGTLGLSLASLYDGTCGFGYLLYSPIAQYKDGEGREALQKAGNHFISHLFNLGEAASHLGTAGLLTFLVYKISQRGPLSQSILSKALQIDSHESNEGIIKQLRKVGEDRRYIVIDGKFCPRHTKIDALVQVLKENVLYRSYPFEIKNALSNRCRVVLVRKEGEEKISSPFQEVKALFSKKVVTPQVYAVLLKSAREPDPDSLNLAGIDINELLGGDSYCSKGKRNETVLMLACERHYKRIATRLLELHPHADLNIQNEKGCTPLMIAADWHFKENKEIIERLLQLSPLLNPNIQDRKGQTALMMASGYEEIVPLLLSCNGIEVNIQDSSGQTALIKATYKGADEVVRQLLSFPGIDVSLRDHGKHTALTKAVTHGHRNIVEMFYRFGLKKSILQMLFPKEILSLVIDYC